RGSFEHCFELTDRHAEYSVVITNDEIAWLDHHSVNRYWDVDLSWSVLVWPAVGNTGRKDRKLLAANISGIADGTIDNHPCDFPLRDLHQHHLAHERVGQIARGIDNNDITRLRHCDSLMKHKVVAGRRLHRQCRACHASATVHRTEPCPTCRQAPHAVAYVRHRQTRETFDYIGVDFSLSFQDPEPCGHRPIPQFSIFLIIEHRFILGKTAPALTRNETAIAYG